MVVFKVGDVVVLKSGGPKMTIIEAMNKGLVYKTCWFTSGVLNWGEFIGQVLEVFEESEQLEQK